MFVGAKVSEMQTRRLICWREQEIERVPPSLNSRRDTAGRVHWFAWKRPLALPLTHTLSLTAQALPVFCCEKGWRAARVAVKLDERVVETTGRASHVHAARNLLEEARPAIAFSIATAASASLLILHTRTALCERKIPIRCADISFNSWVPLQASRWDLLLLFSQGCAFPCAKASLLVNNSYAVRFIAEIENTHTHARTAETSQVSSSFVIWFFIGLSGCNSQSDLASCKCNDFGMNWKAIKTICSGRARKRLLLNSCNH